MKQLILLLLIALNAHAQTNKRPNILFCIADDASYPFMSAYGCKWVNTPGFDRVAKQGILFTHAYTPNAKCAPSRSCILTGRNSWQLEAAANHLAYFPAKFATYVDVLARNGYVTGFTGKGWGPGKPGERNGQARELTGKAFQKKSLSAPTNGVSNNDYTENFKDFLAEANQSPWCFWYGGFEPHRTYEYGTGVKKAQKQLSDIDHVPAMWPDTDTVRNDMLDYALEVEYFDHHLGQMMDYLERIGQLDNTIIIVTADNGMPFPRIKGQEYELSNHLPLAIMWPKGIKKPGRRVDDMVSFIDFAPTFIESAGLVWNKTSLASTPGRSLMPLFKSDKSGQVDPNRDVVIFGKERHDVGRPHDWGYPIRGITDGRYTYIHNYEPTRWPAGNPETGYLNTDGSPTKTLILNLRRQGANTAFWQMNFGLRPAEEFYDIKADPLCMNNLAKSSAPVMINTLKQKLTRMLISQHDPRVLGQGAVFDTYPPTEGQGLYELYMSGKPVKTGWVNDSDFEKTPIKN